MASTDDKWHLTIPSARSCQYQRVCKFLSTYSVWFKSYGQVSLFQNLANPRPMANDIDFSLDLARAHKLMYYLILSI